MNQMVVTAITYIITLSSLRKYREINNNELLIMPPHITKLFCRLAS